MATTNAGVTVLQVSDTHLCRDEPDPDDSFSPDSSVRHSLAALGDLRPDLVLLTGDLTDDGSETGCRRLRSMVEPLGAPILATPGNHDIPDAVAAVFGRAEQAEVGRWRVLTVDTTVPDRHPGSVHAAALAERLDALDERPTLIAVHHPPRSPSTHEWFVLDGADELIGTCTARPHVRGIVSGHMHQAFDDAAGELALVGCPSSLYAISHRGATYELDPTGLVGTQLLHLGDDGALTWHRVRRT